MDKLILTQLTEEEIEERIMRIVQNELAKKEGRKSLEYKTRKETAALLCITLPTLNEYTKSGLIKAYRFGKRVLYRADEIQEALSQVEPLKYRRK